MVALCSTDLLRAPEQSFSTDHSRRAPTAENRRKSTCWEEGTDTSEALQERRRDKEQEKKRLIRRKTPEEEQRKKWTRFYCLFLGHSIIYRLTHFALWNTTLLFFFLSLTYRTVFQLSDSFGQFHQYLLLTSSMCVWLCFFGRASILFWLSAEKQVTSQVDVEVNTHRFVFNLQLKASLWSTIPINFHHDVYHKNYWDRLLFALRIVLHTIATLQPEGTSASSTLFFFLFFFKYTGGSILFLWWSPGPICPIGPCLYLRMAGCTRRCRQGVLKLIQSLQRLVSGTLTKGTVAFYPDTLSLRCSFAHFPSCDLIQFSEVERTTSNLKWIVSAGTIYWCCHTAQKTAGHWCGRVDKVTTQWRKCCKVSFEILLHVIRIASLNFCRFSWSPVLPHINSVWPDSDLVTGKVAEVQLDTVMQCYAGNSQ